jgi:hypothetical protein
MDRRHWGSGWLRSENAHTVLTAPSQPEPADLNRWTVAAARKEANSIFLVPLIWKGSAAMRFDEVLFCRCATQSDPVVSPPAKDAANRAHCEHRQQFID